MKIKNTARGYEARVTVPVVSGTPSAPDDDGSGEAPLSYDMVGKALLTFDRSSGLWQAAGSGGTVTSVASANGSVAVTNPTTTPDLSVRVISAATPGALAAINVSTNPSTVKTGSTAFVAAVKVGGGPGLYILQAAISTTPDSVFVVATADDAARQWVYTSIVVQSFLSIVSDEIDLTATPTVVLLPPLPFTMWASLTVSVIITQKDGTVTTGPTMKVGTDAAFTNIVPATLQTALAAGAVSSRTALTGAVAANANALSPNGLKAIVTVGATLGTATVFKGRVVISLGLYN